MGKKQLRKKYNITTEELDRCFKESNKLGLHIEDYLKSKQEKERDTRKEVLTKYNYHNNFISFDDTITKQFCTDFIYSEWFGKSGTLSDSKSEKERDYNQSIRNFLSIEKHLNNQLYWILFGFLYIEFDVISKSLKERLKETVTKDRLSISLENRSKLCFMFNFLISYSCQYCEKQWDDMTKTDLLKCISEINDKNYDLMISKRFTNNKYTLIKRLSKYLTRKSKQGIKTIKLYRGFSFNKKQQGKVIDKSKTYNNQIVGEGMSYTFDKNVSVFFSLRYQMFGDLVKDLFGLLGTLQKKKLIDKQQLTIHQQNQMKLFIDFFDSSKKIRDKLWDEDKTINFIKNSLKKNRISFNQRQSFLDEYTEERTGYYGVYEVKIDDILFISNRWFERECVTFNYKLLQYKVVDIQLIKKWWITWGRKFYGNQHDYS